MLLEISEGQVSSNNMAAKSRLDFVSFKIIF
jgi:hypothetical protein